MSRSGKTVDSFCGINDQVNSMERPPEPLELVASNCKSSHVPKFNAPEMIGNGIGTPVLGGKMTDSVRAVVKIASGVDFNTLARSTRISPGIAVG